MFPTVWKSTGDFKDKILSLYNSKTSTVISGSREKLSKSKIQEESKDDIINNIRNLFKLKK